MKKNPVFLTIRIAEDEKELAQREAQLRGISTSELVRIALYQMLQSGAGSDHIKLELAEIRRGLFRANFALRNGFKSLLVNLGNISPDDATRWLEEGFGPEWSDKCSQ